MLKNYTMNVYGSGVRAPHIIHLSCMVKVSDYLHSSELVGHQTAGHTETYRLACVLLEPFLHNSFVVELCRSL